ncbi:hypothetical protein RBH29_11550 [Herbivorax sp. ANBcel31]|uniref:hypothetical protein n=1 Tax=Herbivorax sp. ANBcel31 TaxID=3069754 RepID=UPI0027B7BD17|nr:hypothetical protein [Herbivorax sp. ANBcel31]MDQ2087061.1 hypothetical protein [Herbivorax sp. ANBcel31]
MTKKRRVYILIPALIILTVYIILVLIPQMNTIKKLSIDIEELKITEKNIINNEKKYANIESEKEFFIEEINNIRNSLPPYIKQNDLFILLSVFSDFSGIELLSIDISKPETEINNLSKISVDNFYNSNSLEFAKNLGFIKGNKESVPEEFRDIQNGSVYRISANIEMIGPESSHIKFLSYIGSISNKFMLEKYSAEIDRNNLIKANLDIVFFGIADRYANFSDLSIKEFLSSSETIKKENIFRTGNNLNDFSKEEYYYTDAKEYDFLIRLLPFAKQMRNYTFSLSSRSSLNDTLMNLYQTTKREIEEIEISITENNDIFLFEYKNKKEGSNSHNQLEFQPLEDVILILIDSSKRVFENDTSGINLSIYNKSSMPLEIQIINDDKSYSRVNIDYTYGDISILR